MRHCQFFLRKKNRYCRLDPVQGEQFCTNHLKDSVVTSLIECPQGCRHTLLASNLEKHLKKCKSNNVALLPSYIVPGINAGCDEGHQDKLPPLSSLSTEEILKLMKKVEEAYSLYTEKYPIVGKILCHPTASNFYPEKYTSVKTEAPSEKGKTKHFAQYNSLIAHLDELTHLKNDHVYLEFGGGKGELSGIVHQLSPDAEHIIVDRAKLRHATEKKRQIAEMTDKEHGGSLSRVKADIADLHLPSLPALQGVTIFSKHLCGVATDLTLRCATNLQKPSDKSEEKSTKELPITLMIALCCHHKCSWQPFVNKKFFERLGFEEKEFAYLCKMSSWAVSGSSTANPTEITEEGIKSPEIGFKCKRLVDFARAQFLENSGYKVSLYYYIGEDVTPENVLFVAEKIKS